MDERLKPHGETKWIQCVVVEKQKLELTVISRCERARMTKVAILGDMDILFKLAIQLHLQYGVRIGQPLKMTPTQEVGPFQPLKRGPLSLVVMEMLPCTKQEVIVNRERGPRPDDC